MDHKQGSWELVDNNSSEECELWSELYNLIIQPPYSTYNKTHALLIKRVLQDGGCIYIYIFF